MMHLHHFCECGVWTIVSSYNDYLGISLDLGKRIFTDLVGY